MKTCISVLGRFIAFDLARELHKHGALARLITSYPKFISKRFGVPTQLTKSVISSEFMRRGWPHLPNAVTRKFNPQNYVSEHFEQRAARLIPEDADIFVGWSGCSLAGIERAKSMGITTVVERTSSHILTQCQLLTDEYAQFGTTPRVAHPGVVERELAEYEAADYISVPSNFVKQSFLDRGFDAAKFIQAPFGVALDNFFPPEPGTRENDPTFRIIHVGGVTFRKGCHYLLQAFQQLNLPNSELVFVGAVAPEMEPFKERYSSASIKFHGSVPQSELVDHYGKADVFTLASIEEGLAVVTFQAMACGLPVVATTNTGAGDLVNEGEEGFIVPIRNADAIAEKWQWLYDHRETAREMGMKARERVQTNFTWADYGNRMMRSYERIHSQTNQSAGLPPKQVA